MNINERLSIIAKTDPEQIAYRFQDQATTYSELEGKVQRFSAGLQQLGYEKGDHIALITWNSPYFLIAMYGALRLGLVVIPINPMYTATELQYILQDGDVKGIVALDLILERIKETLAQLPQLRHCISISCASGNDSMQRGKERSPRFIPFTYLLDSGSREADYPSLHEEEPAIILYTSGTTGQPKGAILSHRSVYYGARSFAEHFQIQKEDRMITTLPMFHIFSLMVAVNGPMLHGATLLIMQDFSPNEVFRIAHQYKATIFAGVPTMYNYLLQNETARAKKQESFATIRFCLSGGAPFPLALLQQFQEELAVQVIEGYGLTEAAPAAFNPVQGQQKPGSIGIAVPYMEAKVVDSLGEEVEHGCAGELVLKGAAVMTGYYKQPAETAAVLKGDWFYTGDLAYRDHDGYFYIVDRKKDVVIVNGYNVYPREVEEVLYQHPHVVEAAVIGRPHPDSGEEVIGYVVVDDATVTADSLIQFCKQKLAEYKVPARIKLTAELPKNTTGKILRTVLRQQLQSGR